MVLFLLGRISIKVSVNGKETKHFAFWQLWCLGVVVCWFVCIYECWVDGLGHGYGMDGTFLPFTSLYFNGESLQSCTVHVKEGVRMEGFTHSLTRSLL